MTHKFCIAPMLDWTDKHCRFFHRLLSPHAFLYTEMVTTGAILYGKKDYLSFNNEEHPVAFQLGGSEVKDLEECVKRIKKYNYDEINLNCGCPSERVQKGAFGACLMKEANLVADCFDAMSQYDIPITIKHRIGVDDIQDYEFLRDFVGTISEKGCKTFIVHARNAILKGLSPKENREIPPLKYDYVYRLKKDFSNLNIVINGGISDLDSIKNHLLYTDGVMIGRSAYHIPYSIAHIEHEIFGTKLIDEKQVLEKMKDYCISRIGMDYMGAITKHMLGLFHGKTNSRLWRQHFCNHIELKNLKTPKNIEDFFNKGYELLGI